MSWVRVGLRVASPSGCLWAGGSVLKLPLTLLLTGSEK